jgi:hypothetical protein
VHPSARRLFRGGAEGVIRRNLVQRSYLKGIIGLPLNLFFGTAIPACIVVLDKEGAAARKSIFMIDASKGFIKDGNKNRADAIRLMKLWRVRKDVPFRKSFLLELMTIDGSKGKQSSDLEGQMTAALMYVRDNIKTCSVRDPANSNNSLSDDLNASARAVIYQRADEAIRTTYWAEVFS